MSVLLTIARFGIPLALGYAIGKNLEIEKTESDTTARDNASDWAERQIKADLVKHAKEIIFSDSVPKKKDSLADYLGEQYKALYLLGRCGKRLGDSQVGALASKLRHLHHQLDKPRTNQKLIDWYETVGVSNEHQLADLLAKHKLAKHLDTRYIAAALGVHTGELDFSGVADEVIDDFKLKA